MSFFLVLCASLPLNPFSLKQFCCLSGLQFAPAFVGSARSLEFPQLLG